MQNSAILLAAGRSTRFGRDKRREPIAGVPMLLHCALIYKRIVADTLVVLRPDDTDLARLLRTHDIASCLSERSAAGIGCSLAAGIGERAGSDGWLIAPADMPFINAGTIKKILDAGKDHPLAAPAYQGQRGHPVWFEARYLSALRALSGDQGARKILSTHPEHLCLVDVDDAGCTRDVDYPGDLDQVNTG